MSNIALIKKLREETGCPMSDCNKALKENDNDYEKSIDWLRKKGLSSAAKKTGRVTSEGVVAVYLKDSKASVVEVNSETDFVARNQKFQDFVAEIVKDSVEYDDVEKFKADKDEAVKEQIGVIGENITIRRISSLSLANDGVIVSYIHSKIAEDLGKIAVLLALESDANKDQLEDLGKKIAMHIAASKPEALNIEDVPQEKLEREVAILKEQAKSSGKPENIVEKMVEGRIRKYYEEIVLNEQAFVMDDKLKIKDLLTNFAKENSAVKISGYKLFILGEGIEKKENDFAAEVAAITNS